MKQIKVDARPVSTQALTFDHSTYDLWHDDFEESRYDIGSERWIKFFVRNVDYLFNDAVFMKNDEVILCFLREQLMELNRDPNLLKEITKEVINLRDECYYINIEKPKSELVKLSNAADFFKKKGIECD